MLLASLPHSGTQLSRRRRDTDNGHHSGGRGAPRRACRMEAARSGQIGQWLLRRALPGPGWVHVELMCQGPRVGRLRCPFILGAGAQPPTPPAPRATESWPRRRGSWWSDSRTCSPSSLAHTSPSSALSGASSNTGAAGLQPSAQPPHSGAAQQMGTRDSLNTWTVLDFGPNLTAGHRPDAPQSLGITAPLTEPAVKEPA